MSFIKNCFANMSTHIQLPISVEMQLTFLIVEVGEDVETAVK